MPLINTTTILPVTSNFIELLGRLRRTIEEATSAVGSLASPSAMLQRDAAEVFDVVLEVFNRQHDENQQLRTVLEHAITALNQRINQRAAVGLIVERPPEPQDGMLYLSTDETPEKLYVAASGVWHTINTD